MMPKFMLALLAGALLASGAARAENAVKAGELVNFVAQQVGGKGGGKADMAMAGGTNAAGLPQALASVQGWTAERPTPKCCPISPWRAAIPPPGRPSARA